jgi:hypothetical protein
MGRRQAVVGFTRTGRRRTASARKRECGHIDEHAVDESRRRRRRRRRRRKFDFDAAMPRAV